MLLSSLHVLGHGKVLELGVRHHHAFLLLKEDEVVGLQLLTTRFVLVLVVGFEDQTVLDIVQVLKDLMIVSDGVGALRDTEEVVQQKVCIYFGL